MLENMTRQGCEAPWAAQRQEDEVVCVEGGKRTKEGQRTATFNKLWKLISNLANI